MEIRAMNRWRAFGLGMLLAAAAASMATSGTAQPTGSDLPGTFDPDLGVWFPPDAPESAYLSGGDSSRSLTADTRRAFGADPKLRERVCELLTSAENEVSGRRIDPSVAQMRTLQQMMCVGASLHRQVSAELTQRRRASREILQAVFDEEWTQAGRLSAQERRETERRLREEAQGWEAGSDRARAGLTMIALRPQDDLAAAFALAHLDEARLDPSAPARHAWPILPPQTGFSRRETTEFLGSLYRSKASGGGADAPAFGNGLAAYLYLTGGDLKEARSLASNFLSDPADDNRAYQEVFVALLDRLLGDPSPLAELWAKCPDAPADDVAAEISESYCRAVTWSMANRRIHSGEPKPPPALAEIMADMIRAEPTNWPVRMESIRNIQMLDENAAAAQFRAVLELPATVMPVGARLDAIDGLETMLARAGDRAGALRLSNLWLETARYAPAALSADFWTRLAAQPARDPEPVPAEGDPLGAQLLWRVTLATGLHDFSLARKTIEEYAARLDEAGSDIRECRRLMADFADAQAAAAQDDDRAAARRVVSYLWNQPETAQVEATLSHARRALDKGKSVELAPADRPWPAALP
jgi:hypothetical protein